MWFTCGGDGVGCEFVYVGVLVLFGWFGFVLCFVFRCCCGVLWFSFECLLFGLLLVC